MFDAIRMSFYRARHVLSGFVFLMLMLAAAPVAADDPIHETYARQHIREDLTPYGVDLLGEQFDLATGTLSFSHTDVVLPGNNSLDVSIRRSINTAQGRFLHDNEFGDWVLDVPRMEMTVSGEVSSPYWKNDRCTNVSDPGTVSYLGSTWNSYEYWNGLKMHIPGMGAQTVMDNPAEPKRSANTEKTTTQYWDIECTNTSGSQGFKATSPTGVTYTFDKLRYLSATAIKKDFKLMGRKRAQMMATKVEDRFGNTVTYTYTGDNLTKIESSDGRVITIAYSSGRISSVTTNGRTWTYSYSDPNSYGWQALSTVAWPTGEEWDIDISDLVEAEATPGLKLQCTNDPVETATGTITHPYGAKGTYTLTETAHGRTDVPDDINLNNAACTEAYEAQRSFDVLSLTQKKIEGPGLSTYTWDYTYSENQGGYDGDGTNPLKTVRVDKPDGHYDIHHYDRSWSYLEGALVKSETFSSTGTLLQKMEYDYIAGEARGYVGEMFYENITTMNAPRHQTEVKITRGSDVYTTEYAYNTTGTSSDFSYGKPIQKDQYNNFNSFTRTDDFAYEHHKSDWIVGLPTTTKIGTETISENLYFGSAGDYQLQYVKEYGVQVAEFSYNADGTKVWQKDALGNKTQFYSWKRGIPRTIRSPALVNHKFSVNDKGFITSQTDRNGNRTDYSWDNSGRLTLINYPDETGSTRDNTSIS